MASAAQHIRPVLERRAGGRAAVQLAWLAGAFVVARVLTGAATPGPEGARYVFELLWRGALYGTVDALLLTVFPCLVALGLLGGDVGGAARKFETPVFLPPRVSKNGQRAASTAL